MALAFPSLEWKAANMALIAKISLTLDEGWQFLARFLKSDFKWRHFRGEIILWSVRWYCRDGVSHSRGKITSQDKDVSPTCNNARTICGPINLVLDLRDSSKLFTK